MTTERRENAHNSISGHVAEHRKRKKESQMVFVTGGTQTRHKRRINRNQPI